MILDGHYLDAKAPSMIFLWAGKDLEWRPLKSGISAPPTPSLPHGRGVYPSYVINVTGNGYRDMKNYSQPDFHKEQYLTLLGGHAEAEVV